VLETESRQLPEAAVVTGAGRGIGRSIAVALAAKGVHVVCLSQSALAEDAAKTIREAGGSAEALTLDLADFTNTEAAVSKWLAGSSHKRIVTILAAATLGPTGPLAETPLTEWAATLNTNVLGNLAVARAVLPRQIANSYGRILFFAGGGAAYAYPMFPAYAASKTALVRIAENLAEDLKDKGNFAVAILAPGAVETDTLVAVRASGGYVKTTVSIEEPTNFAVEFALSESCSFSGCFVHVRDVWPEYLNTSEPLKGKDLWKLRRVE
jgi:NAD(P)-dependent dehydrogenase (short-subunit alcohol dehydrogenase family)